MSDTILNQKEMITEIRADVKELYKTVQKCPIHEIKISDLEDTTKKQGDNLKDFEKTIYDYIEKKFDKLSTQIEDLKKVLYGTIGTTLFIALITGILRVLKII